MLFASLVVVDVSGASVVGLVVIDVSFDLFTFTTWKLLGIAFSVFSFPESRTVITRLTLVSRCWVLQLSDLQE